MASYIIVCLTLIALSSQPYLANANSYLISKTCDKTLDKPACMSALAEAPESKNADPQGLAKIALDLATKQAKNIHEKIQEFSRTNSDMAAHQHLIGCSENYQDAIDQFEDSQKALESKSYSDVNIWVSSAMSDAEACENGFKERSNAASPLTELNKKFNSLCSVVLVLSNMLNGKA